MMTMEANVCTIRIIKKKIEMVGCKNEEKHTKYKNPWNQSRSRRLVTMMTMEKNVCIDTNSKKAESGTNID